MKITITYKDNSRRIIHPSSAIYKVGKGEPSVNKKIEDLAYIGGKYPYTIVAEEGDKVVFSKTEHSNKPEKVEKH